jgi:hypothetical protein
VFTEGEPSAKPRENFDAGAITQIVADFPEPEGGHPEIACDFVRCDFPDEVLIATEHLVALLVRPSKEHWFTRLPMCNSVAPEKWLQVVSHRRNGRRTSRFRFLSGKRSRHFAVMDDLVAHLEALPADLLELHYDSASFGSWWALVRYRREQFRLVFDGKESVHRV